MDRGLEDTLESLNPTRVRSPRRARALYWYQLESSLFSWAPGYGRAAGYGSQFNAVSVSITSRSSQQLAARSMARMGSVRWYSTPSSSTTSNPPPTLSGVRSITSMS